MKPKYDLIKDKSGVSINEHCIRVSKNKRLKDDKIRLLAYLHEVFEDTDVSEDDLYTLGLTRMDVDTLKLLTRYKVMTYRNYIRKIIDSGDMDAIIIKASDLEDNMDMTRYNRNLTTRDKSLLKRYKIAYHLIRINLK